MRTQRSRTASKNLLLAALRASCQVRTATLCAALAALAKQTRVEKAAAGYRLAKP